MYTLGYSALPGLVSGFLARPTVGRDRTMHASLHTSVLVGCPRRRGPHAARGGGFMSQQAGVGEPKVPTARLTEPWRLGHVRGSAIIHQGCKTGEFGPSDLGEYWRPLPKASGETESWTPGQR